MKFQAQVEPHERMRGLEVPREVVESLGGGRRPPVTITINGHTWRSRVAIMRGRHLIGLSNANRASARLVVGEVVEVELALDTEPRVVAEPPDLARALDADPAARAAWDNLAHTHRRALVLGIAGAKRAETRARRVAGAVARLRSGEAAVPERRRAGTDSR